MAFEVVSTKVWHPGMERFVTQAEHDEYQRKFNSPEEIDRQFAEALMARAKDPEERPKKRPNGFSGKHLTAKTGNVRKAGSRGAQSLQIIVDNPGILFEDYLAKGGRPNDLRWDIDHQRVEVK